MKKLCLLALLSFLVLPLSAQSVTLSGQFTGAVWGFAAVANGTASCQPGPSPAFQPCPLIDDTTKQPPALGVPFTMTLQTVGPKTSITCAVASGSTLPSWMTLTTKGLTCILSGTPTATGQLSQFGVTFTGN